MRISLAVAILVVGAVLVANGASSATPSNATAAHLSSLSGKAFDVAFCQALIPVQEEAIEMAMTATLNADHSELLKWNQVLVERNNAQVRQMLAWLDAMGSHPTVRNAGVATPSVKKLRALKGAALEKAYIPMMTSQMDQSAALARLAAQKSDKPELRTFAQGIVKMDGQESPMLRGWLKHWYNS